MQMHKILKGQKLWGSWPRQYQVFLQVNYKGYINYTTIYIIQINEASTNYSHLSSDAMQLHQLRSSMFVWLTAQVMQVM